MNNRLIDFTRGKLTNLVNYLQLYLPGVKTRAFITYVQTNLTTDTGVVNMLSEMYSDLNNVEGDEVNQYINRLGYKKEDIDVEVIETLKQYIQLIKELYDIDLSHESTE